MSADRTVEMEAVPGEGIGPLTPQDVPEASSERRGARLTMYAGVALLVLGWLVLYLGYNGAATNPPVAAQMPYVISGGFAGASLILLGGVVLLAHVVLGAQANVRQDLRGLTEAIENLNDSLAGARSAPAYGASSANGHVVALRSGSSFHRPDCRLVANRSGLRQLGPPEAERRGLEPCRVCKP